MLLSWTRENCCNDPPIFLSLPQPLAPKLQSVHSLLSATAICIELVALGIFTTSDCMFLSFPPYLTLSCFLPDCLWITVTDLLSQTRFSYIWVTIQPSRWHSAHWHIVDYLVELLIIKVLEIYFLVPSDGENDPAKRNIMLFFLWSPQFNLISLVWNKMFWIWFKCLNIPNCQQYLKKFLINCKPSYTRIFANTQAHDLLKSVVLEIRADRTES